MNILNENLPILFMFILKGADLYINKLTGKYDRKYFHEYPESYNCLFENYIQETDILMNGVYWEETIPRLFEME